MDRYNPFTSSYRHLHEVEQEERLRAEEGREPKEYKMYFIEKATLALKINHYIRRWLPFSVVKTVLLLSFCTSPMFTINCNSKQLNTVECKRNQSVCRHFSIYIFCSQDRFYNLVTGYKNHFRIRCQY